VALHPRATHSYFAERICTKSAEYKKKKHTPNIGRESSPAFFFFFIDERSVTLRAKRQACHNKHPTSQLPYWLKIKGTSNIPDVGKYKISGIVAKYFSQ